MKATLIIFLLSIMSITACSTNNTPKTQYYLLNSPTKLTLSAQQEVKISTVPEHKKQLSVKLLELPDYLAQPNLVLQLANHQLHYSHFHMWAEPLSVGLVQALTDDLNNTNDQLNFILSSEINSLKQADVLIKITAFQATHQSQVILAGSYTLKLKGLAQKESVNITKNDFKFTVNLKSNGYLHSVGKMREIISLLAQNISKTLKASSTNNSNN